MNTKSFFFAMLALMLCSSRVIAKVVTENQAAMIAERLINVQGKKLTRKHQIKAGTSDQSLYYIFTGTDGKGFVIIAADDVARPVLGYSTDAELTPDGELPIPMEQWLTSIGNQIRQAQENGIQQSADVAEQWRVSSMGNTVVKLQTAQWGQSAPFNNQCPYDQGERSDAGCVPMAYAILMKYYKYPQAGKGNTQAYVTDSEGISVASRNLEHTYDWDNMPLKYISGQYNTTQANNVARLVADIGAALQVNYSSNGTGGLEGRGELFSNFDYYPGTARIKDLYSAHAWDEMMREELDKGRPIIYSAVNTEGGGHCFMLDGYTDDDYFSVNWGWTGSYNGFFTLDALTPGSRFYKSGHVAYLNTVPMPSSDADFVVQRNGQLYPTLTAAILDSSIDGTPTTINLLADVQQNSLTITAGKTITLNIGNHSIDMLSSFYNYGNFTVNGTEQSLITTHGNNSVVSNYDVVELKGGSYINECTAVDSTDYRRCIWTAEGSKTHISDVSFKAPGQVICSNGEMTIESGSFTCTGNSSVVRITNSSSMFTILGGTFTCTGNTQTVSNGSTKGTLTIQGGTFINNCSSISGDDYRRCLWTADNSKTIIKQASFNNKYGAQTLCFNGDATINGAEISNENESYGCLAFSGAKVFIDDCKLSAKYLFYTGSDSQITCRGGLYSKKVSSVFLAEGCECVQNTQAETREKYPYRVIDNSSPAINFADNNVKKICVDNWDTDGDGELSEAEAAAVTDLGDVFVRKSITSFNELRYFTGLTSIKGYVFEYCNDLTSITIPNSVTSIIGTAFAHCANLTSVTVEVGNPKYDSRNDCNAIIETATNTLIAGCKNTIIPNDVTSIGTWAFIYRTTLTSITIPNSVTSIDESAFHTCSGLTSVIIPNSVTKIGAFAFYNCSSLTSITIPESVKNIGGEAFKRSGLTSLIITGSMTYIESSAFTDLNEGLNVFCYAKDVPTISEYAFDTKQIDSYILHVPASSVNLYKATAPWSGFGTIMAIEDVSNIEINGIYYSLDTDNKTAEVISNPNKYSGDVVIPESVTYNGETYKVTSIGARSFYDCSGLTSIIIPEGIASIGDHAFKYCRGLTSITIPNSVISIEENAFNRCTGLTSISISSSITIIDEGVFSGCSGLTDVTIPNNVTSIRDYAFNGCSNLTSVTIGNSVTSIGECAFGKNSLTDVYCYAENVPSTSSNAFNSTSINSATLHVPASSISSYKETTPWSGFGTIVAIDNSSPAINFADNNVKKICVDNWDTDGDGELSEAEAAEVKNLGLVFENKSDITSFDELEYFTGLTSIDEKAFSHCSNLISISIPNNVTNIGNSAFYDCYSLTSLIIPESVTWIGSQAFDECQLLNVLIKCVTPPETAGKTFFSEQSFYHTTLYIPSGSWKSYAFDGSWYQFINIRETATTEEQLSMMQAYTLMDAGTFAYSVYDPVNDRISSINKYGIDENNPNHCWQVIEVDGECYLYNLGAKKFVTYSENSLVLTSDATAIEMRNGRDGIVLGEQDGSQWAFVNNDRMNVEDAIADVIFAIQGTSSSLQTDADIYDVDGRKINKARKGINIIRYSDGTSRKVLIK